jgi:hypothetical protein
MTAEFESIAETLLVILTIACIVQVILVGLLLWYVRGVAKSMTGARAPEYPPPAAAGAAPPLTLAPEKEGAEPAPHPQVQAAVEILEGTPDIQGSIHRLCEKYTLSDIIITTLDGLVVVSRYPGSSEEAARFSDLYRRKKKPDSPGVTFLEIAHRGEAMLAIVRSDRPLTPEETKGIGEDAGKILNWWL